MVEYIDVFDVDYDVFRNMQPQTRRPGQIVKYGEPKAWADTICAFDIETTRIKELDQAVMYIWQFAVKDYGCIIGRNWDEFLFLLHKIDKALPEGLRLPIFVHNLSYEFQFLTGIYKFKEWEVFCTDNRKVLYCRMFKNRFEFRCSYKLTNTNLKTFLKDYGAAHQKINGDEFNYDLERWPWTELSDLEMEYCCNDVLGLVEAVDNLMKLEGDNMFSLPLTSTGYVRRDVKKALAGSSWAKDTFPDYDTYRLLRWAFRGGDTHANRWIAGKILPNVQSWDRSSSYPDVMINRKFPVTAFEDWPEDKLDKALVAGYACLIHVCLIDVKLRDKFCGDPYIPLAKCEHIAGYFTDNGRVLSAKHLEICVTDVDWQILKEQYHFKADVITVKVSKYGQLPEEFKNVIIDLYRKKTALKGVAGQETEYALSKTKINACYGMSVQDPVQSRIVYKDGLFMLKNQDPKAQLIKSGATAFLPYAVGVWTTSHARKALHDGLKIVGMNNFVYCDTDSLKLTGSADFSKFNDQCIQDDLASGAWAVDAKGKTHYMGVYEQEETCKRFATVGAKKYAYEDQKGQLHLTISGVNKQKGPEELAALGGLEAFAATIDPEKSVVFRAAGGLEAVYNDIKEPFNYITPDGWVVTVTSNVCLKPSTYTLSISDDYISTIESLLSDMKRPKLTAKE